MNGEKKGIQFLEREDLEKIIKDIRVKQSMLKARAYNIRHACVRDIAILETLFSTGLRISECLGLPAAPFMEMMYNTANKKNSEGETLELSIIGKRKRQRVIFFSPRCIAAIKEYLKVRKPADDCEYCKEQWKRLFPFKAGAIQQRLRLRGKESGFSRLHPHMIRHSFATFMLKKGANLFQVKEFMGHASIASTALYLHVTNSELLEAHKKMHSEHGE